MAAPFPSDPKAIPQPKPVEEELRESELRAHAFWENSPNPIFLKDRELRYLYVNREFERALGVDRERVLGKTDHEVFPEEQAAALQANDSAVLERGVPIEFEEVAQQEDGPHTSIVHKFPLVDVEGEIYAIGGIITDVTERKRSREALQQSEERHRSVLETSADAVVSADHTGQIIFANPAAAITFGYEISEMAGQPLTMLMPEYMRQLHTAGFQRYLETNHRHVDWNGIALTGLRKNGDEFPVEVSFGEALKNGHRVFTGFIRDTTERKRAEEEIRRQQAELKRIAAYLAEAQRLSQTGSFGWNVSNGEIYWSAETFRIFQYEPTTKVSVDLVLQRVHPEDRSAVQKLIDSVSRDRAEFAFEHRLLMPDESVKYLRVVGLPSGHSPDSSEFVGAVTDVTESKRAEEALRASEQSFRLIVDGIAGLVVIMAARGGIEAVNRQFLDYFGPTIDELKGWSTSGAVHPDDLPGVISAWNHSVEFGAAYDVDHRLHRADGLYRWFHARGLPLRDNAGRVVRWYLLLTDIDERKQAEEKLRRSEWNLLEAQRLGHSGSWSLNASLGTVTASPEMVRVFGVKPGEDCSSPDFWFNRIHPEDRRRVRDVFEKCVIEKTDYQDDYRLLLPDGTIRHLHSVGNPILNEAGELVEFVGTAVDTTEQMQAKAELEKALAEIKSLRDQLAKENIALREEIAKASMFEEIVGTSSGLQTVLSRVSKVAPTDATVLITLD